MRITAVLALATAGAALMPAGAQTRTPQARVYTSDNWSVDEHRAALGVSTTATGTLRDTLGVMIASITKGSPAERAGLEEGNRIAAINGVSLRASAADIEDSEIAGTLTRRLSRELAKSKPGDEVELRIYRDGRSTSMKVRTADSDSLFRRTATSFTRLDRASQDDRPALGFSIGSTGSRRDTLGVLVMSVADSTPAAQAGIEEGNRIAAVNGVNLRVASEDAGDRWVGSAKAQRLQREISQLKPGTDVTLRVYSNGQFRDVRVKVARAGDLPRDANRVMILGGNGFGMMPAIAPMAPMPPMPAMSPRLPSRIRMIAPPGGEFHFEVGPEFRQQMNMLSDELRLLGPELESIGPALEQLRPELDRIRTELPAAVRRARVEAIRTQSDR